ncbi:MAG: ATP-binding protein [Pseudomonadota bacterium]|nr:ATP-binding protein [Pseudomonadota bacterium]
MTPEQRDLLITDLLQADSESACVEFKLNNADGTAIGKYISALSNAARLADKPAAYLLWGIRDADRAVVGTDFNPDKATHNKQPLQLWLAQCLKPSLNFVFHAATHRGKALVLLEIPAAPGTVVEFDHQAYLRIGSATPKLSDYPERQRALWAKLQSQAWEGDAAARFVSGDDVLQRLDYAAYFELVRQRLPDNRDGIFTMLEADGLIRSDAGGRWIITHLGAILFARNLADFSPSVARKAIRFVAHGGTNRADTVTHRPDEPRGYAIAFSSLMRFIDGLLPRNEYIDEAFRQERPLYPDIAIRELLANALIHQDMAITGTGPLVEMFHDRIEFTNPGLPLVQPERFLDFPPRSRNEAMAALMRRMRFCEEQGTGIDKVLVAVELHQLPAPDFRAEGGAMRVVLYAPRSFADMTPQERTRACYQHAALKHVCGQKMTNATLRQRLGIEDKNAAQASTVIKQAMAAGLIRPADPAHPRAGYAPFWA